MTSTWTNPIPLLVDVARTASDIDLARHPDLVELVDAARHALAIYDEATPTSNPLHPTRIAGQVELYADEHVRWAGKFLAKFRSPRTIECYRIGLQQWFRFCHADLRGLPPLEADRASIDLFMHALELAGKSPRTRELRLTTLSSFYGYLVDEERLAKNPAAKVERPKYPKKSSTAWLKQGQLYDLIEGARALGPTPHALVTLLAFNGLRISEACSLNIGSIEHNAGHPVIRFIRKGGDEAVNTLSFSTWQVIQPLTVDRDPDEALFLTRNRSRTRMNQRAAQRILDKAVLNVRGEHGRITPHSLRHSAASVALAGGVPIDQICADFGWTRSEMLLRVYGHAHENPHRSSTHTISAKVMAVA